MKGLAAYLPKWISYLFCAFALLLPASSKLASIVLGVLLILCALKKIQEYTFFQFTSGIMILLMLFYLLHVAGLLYTTNFNYAGLDLQIKASFLLMPFLIDNIQLTTADFRKTGRWFIMGCTIYSFILLINALLEFNLWHDISSFYYIDFSAQQHVAYLTLYINLALLLLYDEYLGVEGSRLKNRSIIIAWMSFLIVIAFLLSSRTAIAAVFLTLPVYIYFHLDKSKKIQRWLIPISITGLMFIGFLLVSGSKNRFSTGTFTPAAANNSTANTEALSTVGKNVRFTVWENVFTLIKKQPLLGTGTGDIKDDLIRQYQKTGFTEGITYNLSPHNQFLHTQLLLGLPGIVVLMLLFFMSFKLSYRKNSFLLALFITSVIINCLTEGILEKQAGVLFFVFFLVLFSEQLVKSAARNK